MTVMPNPGAIPQWDRADRLAKSLAHAHVSVQEMAEYLGVSRNTIGNYLGRRTEPDKRTVTLWALRTGVPLAWIQTGSTDGTGPDDSGKRATRGYGLLPARRYVRTQANPKTALRKSKAAAAATVDNFDAAA